VCGKSSDAAVKKTFHWPRPEITSGRSRVVSESLEFLAYLFRWLFRLDERVTLDIPLCSEHRSGQTVRTIVGTALPVIGLALVALNYRSIRAATPLESLILFGAFGMIFGGLWFRFSGANALTLVEFNSAFAAYSGFGLDYMKKIPRSAEIFPPTIGGSFPTSYVGSSRRSGRTSSTLSRDLK
jgi:hypothetical protein